jgi:hypothetical protein
MVSAKEHRALRNTNVITNTHLCVILYPAKLPDPYMVTDFKQPGILDANPLFNHHSPAYFSSEQSK